MAGAVTIQQGVERRKKIIRFIEQFTRKHGYAPSVEEIAEGVQLSSKTAVRHHLAKLRDDGHITMQPGKYRSLHVVPQARRRIS